MNTFSGNIFLVGMMGVGKTTLGRLLARRLGKIFIDTDHEIEKRTGVGIPVIFDVEGEAGFRAREAAIIDELSAGQQMILATGGGAILNPTTRAILQERGVTIYLVTTIDNLLARLRYDRSRPLLQVKDPRSKLAELIAARDPLYREVADIHIETGQPHPRKLVPVVLRALETLCPQILSCVND